jgi:hypothetical protein
MFFNTWLKSLSNFDCRNLSLDCGSCFTTYYL